MRFFKVIEIDEDEYVDETDDETFKDFYESIHKVDDTLFIATSLDTLYIETERFDEEKEYA